MLGWSMSWFAVAVAAGPMSVLDEPAPQWKPQSVSLWAPCAATLRDVLELLRRRVRPRVVCKPQGASLLSLSSL
jgi:hypothetical protein